MNYLEDAILQLPTPDMFEEIISSVPNIPIETREFYWLGGYYPQHCVFVDSCGDVNDCANDNSECFCFKVRPVLYFKEDLPGNKGDLILVVNPSGSKGLKSRYCVIIDKRRAIVVEPFCPTYHHDNWDAWLNSPSFKDEW